jgi:hypothetical protein
MLFKFIVVALLALNVTVGVYLFLKASALEKEIAAEKSANEGESHEDDFSADEQDEEFL